DVERKLLVKRPADDLVADPLDEIAFPAGQEAKPGVHNRGGLLDIAVGQADLDRHSLPADAEVLEAALRLGPPVAVGRHCHLTEAVELASVYFGLDADRQVKYLGRCGGVCHDL